MSKLKVLFMGTPDFAVPVFKMLAEKYNVVCAVTKPDKPKGRGHKMMAPPIKELALSLGIDVIQPESVKTEEFYNTVKSYGADVFVTCAYGKILPLSILELAPKGCINVHASILPFYRGSAPLWHVVINGENETGITTMLTDEGMDTGDILLIDKIPIGPNDTFGDIHDRLSFLGAETLAKTLALLEEDKLVPVKQDHDKATYAPMLTKEMGRIDWSLPGSKIHDLVRGLAPAPGSYTTYEDQVFKIWQTEIVNDKEGLEPGRIYSSGAKGIEVGTGKGMIRILQLQGPSGKRMNVRDYLNGHSMDVGAFFQ